MVGRSISHKRVKIHSLNGFENAIWFLVIPSSVIRERGQIKRDQNNSLNCVQLLIPEVIYKFNIYHRDVKTGIRVNMVLTL